MQLFFDFDSTPARGTAPTPIEWTPESLRARLRKLGARRLEKISFRNNRVTIWSLTQCGSALNLHAGYRNAPESVVDHFVDIVRHWRRPNGEYRAAARKVREWSELQDALDRARAAPRRAPRKRRRAACCGTPEQRLFLRAMYVHLNRTRFGGRLPERLRLRFSPRMKRRLGHMAREETLSPQGQPMIPSGPKAWDRVEIALSVDLLIPGNEDAFRDTLLHEMAHVADYLTRGTTDHGPEWTAWARRVGCDPTLQASKPIRRRRRGQPVLDVPSLPPELRELLRTH